MAGLDLAKDVSVQKSYSWDQAEWHLGSGYGRLGQSRYHVVAFDYGVKQNILRMLAERGCKVTVVPAKTPASEVRKLKPDGVFLSNGPGDPEPCDYAIEATRQLVEDGYPTFGICLGHQILALASGAKTFKMKFGHHGANHPVKDLVSGRTEITSQNHGFAVLGPDGARTIDTDEAVRWDTAFGAAELTHINLYDRTVEGLTLRDVTGATVQYHPEAGPGPHDSLYLFDRFVDEIRAGA
jgi:carbamoyl-phosphate synthase small subunit